MSTSEENPCRLAVFLARAALRAAILRRGPSEWVQLSLWNRADDTFEHGQWFHGRVYERRCDLSPDGRHFVYFAASHGRPREPSIGEAWTAVSRAPFFTALSLWTNLGSWYGGGVFETDRQVVLDATCTLTPHRDFCAPPWLEIRAMAPDTVPWEQRLLRDGWELVERGFDPRTHRRVGERELWRKPRPDGDVVLWREVEDVDFRRHGGPYRDVYWLESKRDLFPLDRVTWADWDDGERLATVEGGRLHRVPVGPDGPGECILLCDFNPFEPEPVETPAQHRCW